MAFTTAQKETLEKVIASGASEVGTGPNRVRYRELRDLRDIRDEIDAETGASPIARVSLAEFGED
jgi:hypothetical protein